MAAWRWSDEITNVTCTNRRSEENPGLELVRTGVFIQSIHFVGSNDINLNGYVWQKYGTESKSRCGELLRKAWSDRREDVSDLGKLVGAADEYNGGSLDICGVVFPEEIESNSTEEKLVYVENNGNYSVLGWYFDVTVRQAFDYADYPLDSQKVWLRMWPGDIQDRHRMALVPDFESYASNSPCPGGAEIDPNGKELPGCRGLDQKLVKGAWRLEGTFFDYGAYEYDTNMGFGQEGEKGYRCPELRLNVVARREFRDAFVINLVPLLIVALLLFSQVMMVTGKQKRSEAFGFNAAGVIAICAALFFVVMLAHIQLRSQFAGSGVMYIEYFYFIMYLFILLTALNAYVFSLGRLKRLNVVFYNDNFIPNVSFWPILLWMMVIATVFELGHRLWS